MNSILNWNLIQSHAFTTFYWLLHCWQYNNTHTHKSYSCFFYQQKTWHIGFKDGVEGIFYWEFEIRLVIIYIKIVYSFSGYFRQIIREQKFTQPSTFETIDRALLKFSHKFSLIILNRHRTELTLHFVVYTVHACTQVHSMLLYS